METAAEEISEETADKVARHYLGRLVYVEVRACLRKLLRAYLVFCFVFVTRIGFSTPLGGVPLADSAIEPSGGTGCTAWTILRMILTSS